VSVVLVPLFLAVGWKKTVGRWTAAGVAIAFFGLYFLTVPAMEGAGWNSSSINRGDLLTLGCAVAFALQIILTGRAAAKYSFRQIALVQLLTCAVLSFASAPLLETPYVTWSSAVIAAILVTGIFSIFVGFTVQAWAQQFTPPTHTALIFSLEPVFALACSYVWLHERLGARALMGAAMILAGVLTSELKESSASEEEEHGSEMAELNVCETALRDQSR